MIYDLSCQPLHFTLPMKRYCHILLFSFLAPFSSLLFLSGCDYEEDYRTEAVTIHLVYPSTYDIGPYRGARVEMQDAAASVFVDSTDSDGMAHFRVPAGVYSITSANTIDRDGYRYICNGTKGQVVISPDSANNVRLELYVTRRKIVTSNINNQ